MNQKMDLYVPVDSVECWTWWWRAWKGWRHRKACRHVWVLDLARRLVGVLAGFEMYG